jgi:hypothetical protein
MSTVAASAARPPSDDDPSAAGELYGDLYVLERDGNGEPILFDFTYVDPYTSQEVEVSCPQPLAFGCALADCGFIPLNVEKLDFDPEVEDACAPQAEFEECLHEVSFGRGSVARSQPFVIDSAYAEVIKTINEATGIDRDPSGRVMLEIVPEDAIESVWKTVDAPLENLGLYREVMTRGCLGTVTDEVVGEGGVATEVTYALDESAIDLLCGGTYDEVCANGGEYVSLLCAYPDFGEEGWWLTPVVPDAAGVDDDDLLWATTFLAGATDKSDLLHLDEILNINTYLGINEYTWTKVRKERILEVDYFDFGDFTYDQDMVFDAGTSAWLLATSDGTNFWAGNISLFTDPDNGVDLAEAAVPICRGGEIRLDNGADLICDSSSDELYDPDNEFYGCGGANYFTQAAEHARKTIWYLHNWAVPEWDY